MSENDEKNYMKVPTPWGSLELRGVQVLLGTLMVSNVLLTAAAWAHTASEENYKKQLTAALHRLAISQTELACILAQNPEHRKEWWDTGRCRRIAEGGK